MEGNGTSGVPSGSQSVGAPVVLRPARRRLFDEMQFAGKRTLDIIGAFLLLALVSPALIVVAIAIKLDSKGPVLFVQERVGSKRMKLGMGVWWEPRTFRCLKFRTMFSNADDAPHRSHIKRFVEGTVELVPASDAAYKIAADERITRVGKWLRRLSLDELPQLLNVLKGDMSLVGPRPVPVYEVAEYEPWHYERLAALPGITGHWQVHGRGRTTFSEMVNMDIRYVRRPSLIGDLRLLLATVPAVLTRRGAL